MIFKQCECLMHLTLLEERDEHLEYDPDLAAEWAEHAEEHPRRLQAMYQFGRRLLGKAERDQLLEAGNSLVASWAPVAERARGYEMIIDAAFSRSAEQYLGSNLLCQHPSRNEYTARLDYSRLLSDDLKLAEFLREKYGAPRGPYIDWYSMMWMP